MVGWSGRLLMESKKNSNWYLLTGLLIGLAIGLIVSIFIVSVEFADAQPANLSETGLAEYRGMIALAYSANQDLERALNRLVLLEDADPVAALAAQEQAMLAVVGSETVARALAELAAHIGQPLP